LIYESFRNCSGLKKEKPLIISSILQSLYILDALLRSRPLADNVVSLSRNGLV
jgi:hypothetical protein